MEHDSRREEMSDTIVTLGSQQLDSLTIFPSGEEDVKAFRADPAPPKDGKILNGSILPPLESDYLQYNPNNQMLSFLNKALSLQASDARSYGEARKRARALYTTTLLSQKGSSDQSLMIVKEVVDNYTNTVSEQERINLAIGLNELTAEQLLRLVDEQARLVKVGLNEKLEMVTLLMCVITTAITVYTVFQSVGVAATPAKLAGDAAKGAVRRFLSSICSGISSFFGTAISRMVMVSSAIGDLAVTASEIANVWDDITDGYVRSDRDSWLRISTMMRSVKNPEPYVYQYVMKPSEMIGLFAIWERGERAVLDSGLRNLIYGKPVYFATNSHTFANIKYRISRVGKSVEYQLGTPSLFPAFALALRLFARMAKVRAMPIASSVAGVAQWKFRWEMLKENSRQ
jgi:hypothetical protein